MCYSPTTIVARLAGGLIALCLTACGGGSSITPDIVPEVATEEAPRPLVPIATKILFSHSGAAGLFEVWAMDGDGDARTPLAASPNYIAVQDLSVDGQTALFIIEGNLFMMNVDGSDTRPVLTGPGSVFAATFSPDGTQILYWSQYDSVQHVYVLDLNVGKPRPFRVTTIFSAGASRPRFNHDGSRIVFASHEANLTRIWTINPDGTNPYLVALTTQNFGARPRFNHDGTMICYISPKVLDREGSVYVVNADGTGSVQVTSDPGRVSQPVFSADGNRVFFTSSRSGDSEIYSVSLTGTDLRNVTNRPGTAEYGYVVTASGQQILFTSAMKGGAQIWAMNSDGSGQAVLSRGSGYDIMPIVPGDRR